MAMAALLPAALAAVLILLPFSSMALTQDFCVADLSVGDTPAGYPCKRNVTADDFHHTGLAKPGEIIEPFGLAFILAFVKQFPGLNGLGLSAARVDFTERGVIALHTHPRASEFIYVLKGNITVGFISAETNTVYTKTLGEGEMFVFPQGLLHYQYNAGKSHAAELAVFNNPDPGLQVVDYALFSSVVPTDVVEKVTFLSEPEVRRLKAMFNGTG